MRRAANARPGSPGDAASAAKELQEHITGTYFSLRIGMVLLGYALPPVLVVGGLLLDAGVPVRTSMSAYYDSPSLRDVFVGSVIAIGAFLILYKGFRPAEDRALTLAGICAVGTALAPPAYALHAVFAVAFFLLVGYVCLFTAGDTLPLVGDADRRRRYERAYRGLGALMIALPVLAAVLALLLFQSRLILAVEWAAVWVFGSYWLVKSLEFHETHAEERAARGRLAVVREAPAGVEAAPSPESSVKQVLEQTFGDYAVVEVPELPEPPPSPEG